MRTWIMLFIFVLLASSSCGLLETTSHPRYPGEENHHENPHASTRAGRGAEKTRITLDGNALQTRMNALLGMGEKETAQPPEADYPDTETPVAPPVETSAEPEARAGDEGEVIDPWAESPSGDERADPGRGKPFVP